MQFCSTVAKRGSRKTCPELDLHGLTRREATRAAHDFLLDCQRRGFRQARLITGQGNNSTNGPVLRSHVAARARGAWKFLVEDSVEELGAVAVWIRTAHASQQVEFKKLTPRNLLERARHCLGSTPREAARLINHVILENHSRDMEPVSWRDSQALSLVLTLLEEEHGVGKS